LFFGGAVEWLSRLGEPSEARYHFRWLRTVRAAEKEKEKGKWYAVVL
jgi:hypothetical protein